MELLKKVLDFTRPIANNRKLAVTNYLKSEDQKMTTRGFAGVVLLVSSLGFVGQATAQIWDGTSDLNGGQYKVTVTNLVHGTPATNVNTAAGSPVTLAKNTFFGTPNITNSPAACQDPSGAPIAGQMLGLWVFAIHDQNFSLFTLGQPADPELARLSQTGRPFYLANKLSKNPDVNSVFTIPPDPGFALPNPTPFPPPTGVHDIVLCPGESLSTMVTTDGPHEYLSLAAMVFPTNDGFVGVSGVPLPQGTLPVTVYSPAYDSGSEENDELCVNIPSLRVIGFPFPLKSLTSGAACPDGSGAQDFNSDPLTANSPDDNPARAEGYVHVHGGIKGVGDLDPNVWNWQNPVMMVTIQRVY